MIIFIVLGAIILPASFIAFSEAIKQFARPDEYVKARFYAEQKMEELTSNTYDCVCTGRISNPSGLCVIGGTAYDCTVGLGSDVPETNWSRSWAICYVSADDIDPSTTTCGSTYTNYKRITITLTPPSSGLSYPDYVVKTLVTKRPKAS
ncbi:MAG: hypothetical protein A4E58_00004 [Syntrophorhabdus sp. PtaB.Bin006]|nr:MAG: hypothetical protein A4E58_00004 [Syntrophorhabdus sp. PtaB.Bin006]